MPVASSRPLRARSALEKIRRRDEILRAAERLWLSTSYADLSMNQIAREARLAKGTLYLYFDTKEELFLALLHEYLQTWFQHFNDLLGARQPRTPSEMTATLIVALEGQDHLRRLLLLLSTVLRSHLSPEVEADFRRDMHQLLQQTVHRMPYTPDINRQILIHCYALAVGWQQMAAAPEQVSASETASCEGDTAFRLALEAIIERLGQQAQAS
ncbi:TetR/AcrR family transcriptional regulator [Deinococcus wulumuqiensis]